MSFNRRKFLMGAAAMPLLVAAAGTPSAAAPMPEAPTPGMDDIGMLIYPGFTALDSWRRRSDPTREEGSSCAPY